MKIANKVQEWMNYLEWEDSISFDEENQLSKMQTTFGICEQPFALFIETDEKKEYIKLFLYPPFRAREDKWDDFEILINQINIYTTIGGFCLLSDGRIQYRHFIDVENSEPSIKMIQNMMNSCESINERWFESIVSVALTSKKAKEIIKEINAEKEENEIPNSV